jgi:CheY-like chemotaxis protein
MAHLVYLLAAASPPKPLGSGLNLLQVLLAVLTVILLILFVGFLLSGRRRVTDKDAAGDGSKAGAPHTPDDGVNPLERVIYHAQPRPMTFSQAVAEAPPEPAPEPPAADAPAPVETEPLPEPPAPAQAPAHPSAGRPLTAWARSPAVAPVSSEGREPSPGAPPVKAPPFIFPSTQRADPPPPNPAAVERPGSEPSTASIAAPVAAPPPAARVAAPPTERPRVLEEPPASSGQPGAAATVTPAAADGAPAVEVHEGALILLIEDDERIAKFYTMLFQAKGFRVENAHDGIEGVDMAQSLNPALILLDVMMPRMNGLMVLQVLRANPETAKTPVVVLSNYMEPPLIQRALQLGAIEYVVKSQARPEQLVNAVPSWLRGEPAIH